MVPGAGAIVGRADVMEMLLFKDAEWNRYKRVSHPGTFNGNPLCAAAGIAALKILATGEPQRQATKMANILRQDIQQSMRDRGIAGCAYGDSSLINMYFGKCEMRDECDREACLNANKVSPSNIGSSLSLNLILNGIKTLSSGIRAYVSAVHTEEDISKTIKALGISLDTMIQEGILKRE